MYQQLWGYKVEEKLYLGVREQKKVEYHWCTAIMITEFLDFLHLPIIKIQRFGNRNWIKTNRIHPLEYKPFGRGDP
jgi:hypothetical protein